MSARLCGRQRHTSGQRWRCATSRSPQPSSEHDSIGARPKRPRQRGRCLTRNWPSGLPGSTSPRPVSSLAVSPLMRHRLGSRPGMSGAEVAGRRRSRDPGLARHPEWQGRRPSGGRHDWRSPASHERTSRRPETACPAGGGVTHPARRLAAKRRTFALTGDPSGHHWRPRLRPAIARITRWRRRHLPRSSLRDGSDGGGPATSGTTRRERSRSVRLRAVGQEQGAPALARRAAT